MFGFLKRDKFPVVIHFTHAKAGSTWIDGILRGLFGKRVKPRCAGKPDFSGAAGCIYPAVFMVRDEALSDPAVQTAKRFFIMRDLRDTLISRYFSMRYSHKPDAGGKIEAMRERLRDKTETDGLTEVLNDDGVDKAARIQRSWLGAGEIVLRYEDLIANDVPLLVELFVEKLGLLVTAKEIERVVASQRFDTLYGRKMGEEDVMSHGRKGVAGDWRNHFTRQMAELFHSRYGDLLKDTGYESDAAWVATLRD